MKRSAWIRLLAVVLVCCIVAAPTASAAPYARAAVTTVTSGSGTPADTAGTAASAGTAATGSFWSGLAGWFGSLFGGSETLAAGDAGVNPTADTTTTLKYFPVTLYNYDKTTINNATHQVEVDNGLGNTWNGIYFSDGNPGAESYTYTTSAGEHRNLTWAQVQAGTYYSDVACTKRVTVNAVEGPGTVSYTKASVTCNTLISSDAEDWTATGYYYTPDGTNYYPLYAQRKSGWRYTYTWGYSTTSSTSNVTRIGTQKAHSYDTPNIKVYRQTTVPGDTTGYTLTVGSRTLATLDGTDTTQQVGVTLYTPEKTVTTGSLPYAVWNFWNKGDSSSVATGSGTTQKYGQYTYSGLVKSTLDANKNIVFTKPDGGIFNSDTTVKDIYTNVEVPFVFGADGFYTFDSSKTGAYFHKDTDQKSTTAQSNGRLYYQSTPQTVSGATFGDGSSGAWAPFDDKASLTGTDSTINMDYHFGMRATVPFTMTTNGMALDGTTPIQFSFSGDDDVWIFIDGQLVIDLGGIHNRLDATINFAENAWSITASNSIARYVSAADFNGVAISGALFNDGDTTGILNTTRETFAATSNHELTIFYLERGAGSSNAQIKFNLPVKDSVSVKKQVSTFDNEGIALDAATLEQINNRDFGFTLYKGGKGVANTNYYVLNENGQYLETRSTNANGHFTLKNGQTAKFEGKIDNDSYYVVEDKDDGGESFWLAPEWTYTAHVEGGATDVASETDGQSMTVTAVGGENSEDSIVFTCTNIWKHQDKTSISAVHDYIVIDFGLPVVIDPLKNDTVSYGVKSLESVTGAQYGNAEIKDGKITYQLTKQLTGVEVLTYTVKATANSEVDNKTATAKIYIIPATSMYYEENFSNLVTFTNGKDNVSVWESDGTAQTDPQEPGVVGTVGDSPYGSDAAYLNDGGDSNGTSMYVNTANGPASFSYTFTGTGTSFFARTTNNSGYMRIVIKDADDNTVYTAFRDTSYKTENDLTTLYNIPVFTWEAEGGEAENGYGTYTVTVSIAGGANIVGKFGTEFWLDGIRVMNPLNPNISSYEQATGAYATDGEANMTVVTLRQKLIGEAQINEDDTISWNNGDNFVLFTDTNGKITSAEEYRSNGPKEEVYLNAGQSVTFSLTNWDPNTNKIYLGIKAPFGTGTVSINGNTLNINNATDCYYDISNYGTITTDEDGIKTVTFKIEATSSLISVTNIKVTGNAKFTIVNSPNKNVGGSEGSDENNEDIIVD